jgi:23S rRNA (guanosine2251-2'-O)-methyltransferase
MPLSITMSNDLFQDKNHFRGRSSVECRLFLDNIRSVHNVGSLFRTAETIGITHIYCLGTTPTPLDRFDNKRSDFAKVALGAEESIVCEHIETGDEVQVLKKLKKQGFKIISLEQMSDSVDYKSVGSLISREDKLIIILGNEVEGVSKELLTLSDIVAEIPMRGDKESLNVSVSAGIFLYRLLDK